MTQIDWQRLKAAEIRALAARDAVAIVPVGSTEQHGPHLPTQVDSLLVSEIARRAAHRAAAMTPIVVTPTVWSGLAEHHMSLGGTLSLDFTTFLALLRCICGVKPRPTLALTHFWCRDVIQAPIDRARSRSSLARPYIWRFTSFSFVIWPSVWPLDHGSENAASTAP